MYPIMAYAPNALAAFFSTTPLTFFISAWLFDKAKGENNNIINYAELDYRKYQETRNLYSECDSYCEFDVNGISNEANIRLGDSANLVFFGQHDGECEHPPVVKNIYVFGGSDANPAPTSNVYTATNFKSSCSKSGEITYKVNFLYPDKKPGFVAYHPNDQHIALRDPNTVSADSGYLLIDFYESTEPDVNIGYGAKAHITANNEEEVKVSVSSYSSSFGKKSRVSLVAMSDVSVRANGSPRIEAEIASKEKGLGPLTQLNIRSSFGASPDVEVSLDEGVVSLSAVYPEDLGSVSIGNPNGNEEGKSDSCQFKVTGDSDKSIAINDGERRQVKIKTLDMFTVSSPELYKKASEFVGQKPEAPLQDGSFASKVEASRGGKLKVDSYVDPFEVFNRTIGLNVTQVADSDGKPISERNLNMMVVPGQAGEKAQVVFGNNSALEVGAKYTINMVAYPKGSDCVESEAVSITQSFTYNPQSEEKSSGDKSLGAKEIGFIAGAVLTTLGVAACAVKKVRDCRKNKVPQKKGDGGTWVEMQEFSEESRGNEVPSSVV